MDGQALLVVGAHHVAVAALDQPLRRAQVAVVAGPVERCAAVLVDVVESQVAAPAEVEEQRGAVLGGEVDERSLWVAESNIPKVGEHGVYFVESLEGFYVNPILGWAQGHFLIQTDEKSGAQTVRDYRERAVVEVEVSGGSKAPGISAGLARGVRVATDSPAAASPITLEAFKASIHQAIEEEP